MSLLKLKPKDASMVWLEPHRVHAGGRDLPLGDPAEVARSLGGVPEGPAHWVVDDLWMPCLLVRDLVEVPARREAREAFFRWRFTQSLGLDTAPWVQAAALGGHAWLLAGMDCALRDGWLQAAAAARRPIRSLVPRWLWLYNRLAPSREGPGLLLSLCPGEQGYTGTLAAWDHQLLLLRQWAEPAPPEVWQEDRVLPTVAYLHRDGRTPRELQVWGTASWPEGPVPATCLPAVLPDREPC